MSGIEPKTLYKRFERCRNEDFAAGEDESFNMLISVAKGELNVRDVEVWIREHLRRQRSK
jgi:hypothetical protein